ncbi:hypothetical protein JTB14_019997 [Gonioctena quinquepunctata]|nr:hypothetical protein JTB14_019997 [Gonioctena quinquepunctata]
MLEYIFVLATISVASIHPFTITDKDPLLPIQMVLTDNAYTRIVPLKKPMLIVCPEGTVLNKETLTCDFRSDRSNVLEANLTAAVDRCLQVTMPANDCRHFTLCGPSGSYEMPCSGVLLFNRAIGVCDYPKNSHCCEFVEKNPNKLLQDA